MILPATAKDFRPEPGTTSMRLLRYREADFEEKTLQSLDELPEGEGFVHWLDIVQPDKGLQHELYRRFDLHPLSRDYDDVAGRRPTLYEFDNHLLITARTINLDGAHLRPELIGLVMGQGYLISLQEHQEDAFESVRDRIRQKIGWIRTRNSDHLLYRLLDAIAGEYLLVAEMLEKRADDLMDQLGTEVNQDFPNQVRHLRSDVLEFRRSVAPLRDILSGLLKIESKLLSKPVIVFLRDVHQQTLQLVESGQSLLEQIKEIQDRHHLLVSERINDTMKVLTLVTSFFIPLSFLAGVYGMNFQHMPEMSWKYSYAVFWAVVLAVVGVMIWLFRRKGWF
jgi:magnesium transporter